MQFPLTRFRRRHLVAAIAAAGLLAVAAIVGIASANTDHAKRSSPSLRMVRLNPATVAGRGFKPHRRVHVRLMVGATLSRRPLANGAGKFTVQFPTVIDRCSGFTVTASQQNHPAVVLHAPPKPECAPAMTP
ncbi:MAG: hypothetical protein ACXVEW_00875 [Solirubrobacteraceae bacterium]